MVDASALDVSVVVPVYGGVTALSELCKRVGSCLTGEGLHYEVILVDDRGDKRAWATIQSIAATDPNVKGIRLSRNFGQHAATLCGIVRARGNAVVTMDDDLEHPPESIPTMLAACTQETPLVYGVFPVRTHAWYRNISSELMRKTLKVSFPDLNDSYTSFRCIHHVLAEQLSAFELSRPYLDGMLSWLTASVATAQVEHGARRHGESAYTLRKLISHALNIFITFSHLPLRMATYFGTTIAAISFLYLSYIVIAHLTGSITNPGYASLMSVVLFTCGVQLVILGVVGEYIGRLMGVANKKPAFAVQATTPA
ncbi:glycosyltransferase family 2 protein [Lysobacter sp. H21R4]|uniref:glycosyltransferase family 2 protein n=1 Tax=Lysobacter sp. H21R4 TaxID=2781021 RepID=UPI001887EB7D|nr:glycosyltransferase family 2 protein [Lysobacter sp. H21R4]QOY62381.1 glycosyltransferase family 2 protein [Lysobacter sp. H21R4]